LSTYPRQTRLTASNIATSLQQAGYQVAGGLDSPQPSAFTSAPSVSISDLSSRLTRVLPSAWYLTTLVVGEQSFSPRPLWSVRSSARHGHDLCLRLLTRTCVSLRLWSRWARAFVVLRKRLSLYTMITKMLTMIMCPGEAVGKECLLTCVD
jgi:hypothetical protein